ncbi:MAG TPA: hypothetical protein VNZ47_02750, partial [Candidatus Dormibacteraeota bacterium]|nr:hypothetical protein [Candidatus Dormibacteraeota bacterium]
EARALMLMLPAPEDANAIQVGLMRIQKAVIEDTISMKKAGLLLYSMQLALTNVGQTTFGQAKDEEMVRDTVDEMEALTNQHSALSQDETFETQRNGGSGGEEGLPRINADERGLENSRNPIEWKPTVDMYRMDTREGMEAYEASLRRNIAPTFASQRREMQLESAAIPHEHAEVHNSSLRDERLQFSSLTQDSSPGLGPRKPNGSLDADTVVGSVLQTEPYANLG